MMRGLALTLALAGLALPASAAAAKPPVCSTSVVRQALIDRGKLTAEGIGFGEDVDVVRCGDVTGDGASDALFTIASGGTAGDTRFGVLRGRGDGSPGALVLYRQGYKIGVARRNRRSFEVLQPHYRSGDANAARARSGCAATRGPGAYFKAGRAKKLKTPPKRFYRR
jgi:hypothetical protein